MLQGIVGSTERILAVGIGMNIQQQQQPSGGSGIDARYPPYQGGQQQTYGGGSTMQGVPGVGMGTGMPQISPVMQQSGGIPGGVDASGRQAGQGQGMSQSSMMQHVTGRMGQQGAGAQQHFGGSGVANGLGVLPGASMGYATSPQGVNHPSYQPTGSMGGFGAGRAGGLTGGGTGYVQPSGDLLSMLNNKSAGASAQHHSRDEGPAFSMSDFPSLSASGTASGTTRMNAHEHGGDAVGALLGTNRGLGHQSPAFGEEDFPALPGAPGAVRRGSQQQGTLQMQQQQQRAQQQRPVGKPVDLAATMGQNKMTGAAIGTRKPGSGTTAVDRHGLLGLLHVIRMSDPDLTTLALGTDLTTLGLNLNSPEPLWKTFSSPWADGPSKQDVDPKIPDSFIAPIPPLSIEHFYRFKPDSLFYIFYGMPGDEAQMSAAEELVRRGWMYHKELKTWLTRVPNSEPVQKMDRAEIGSFLVFDVSNWEVVRKDNFSLSFDAIEEPPALPKSGVKSIGAQGPVPITSS